MKNVSQPHARFAVHEAYGAAEPFSTGGAGVQTSLRYIKDTDDKSSNNYSHYFVLKNTALSSYVGFVDNNLYHCYGWRNVSDEEIANGGNVSIDGQYEDGLRVLYLESLTAYSEGNNPHVGFGDYDDGDSYLERFRNLFSDMYQEGKFDYLSNSEDADDKADYEKLANGYGFVGSGRNVPARRKNRR